MVEEAIDAVVFDVDGTLARGNRLIETARLALAHLLEQGIEIFFFSNSASRSREQLAMKLRAFGLPVELDHVYNSAYAVACWIHENHPETGIFAISHGIQEELMLRGLVQVNRERDIHVVAAGYTPDLTERELVIASRAIDNGALFIASNLDATYPTAEGIVPEAGEIIDRIVARSERKIRPSVVLGKPNPFILERIQKEHKLERQRMVMVGDRHDTDIMVAKNFGCRSVAVAGTGVLSRRKLKALDRHERPDHVMDEIGDITRVVRKFRRY